MKRKTKILLATVCTVVLCVGVGIAIARSGVFALGESPAQGQQQEQEDQVETWEGSNAQEQQREWEEIEDKIRRGEGEADGLPPENVVNIENLSTLPSEYLERSLLYVGNFLTWKGYDAKTVKISIFNKIEVSSGSSGTTVDTDPKFNFYFQVIGEDVYCSVRVLSENRAGQVYVGELTEHVEGVNDDLY